VARKFVAKAQQEMRAASNSPSLPPFGGKGPAEGQLTSSISDAGKTGDVPDASPEFRSEFAALLAYYAARIAAARRGLPANEVFAAVQAIMNEQTVALRALAERQAAAQRQHAEKPERPTQSVQRRDDDAKPS
jgi:hypothetical protein